MLSFRSLVSVNSVLFSCLLCLGGPIFADQHDATAKRYQADRAACEAKPEEERADCRREAAAARDEAARGWLSEEGSDYARNALARCDPLPESERELCRRRTRGEGVVEGSVSEGGIYREYRVITLPDAVSPEPGPVPGQDDKNLRIDK